MDKRSEKGGQLNRKKRMFRIKSEGYKHEGGRREIKD